MADEATAKPTKPRRRVSNVKVGDPLPAVLVVHDLADLLGIGLSRAYELENAGEFVMFELKPRVGKRVRYSGKKVQAWLDGTDLTEPLSAGREYFGSAKR